MPELADPTTWRSGKPYKSYGMVYIWQPPRIFEARLNLASATYPLTTLPFDGVTTGAYTDIEAGLTLMVGSAPGKDDYGRTRVRATASSTNIPIGRTPKGTHVGEIKAVDNAYITVIDLAEVWSKIPYIDAAGVSLKDETAFGAAIAQPPIANGGPAVIGFVNEDDELIVNFTDEASEAVDESVFAGSVTPAWNFEDATPSSSTNPTPTGVAFPPGQRYVKLTVDDGVRTHRTRIPVVALEKTGVNAPIPARLTSRSPKAEGQNITLEVKAVDLPYDNYPFGTLVIYFEEEWYGATKGSLAGTAGREHVKFVGWLTSEVNKNEATAKGMDYTLTLNAVDVAGKLAKLPAFGQRIQNNASPTNWQQMANANLSRYLHHLLHWHSTALEVAPFTLARNVSSYIFADMGSDGQTLYSQVDQRARAIAHRLTCNSRNEMQVNPDPQRFQYPTSTVIVALDRRDWSLVNYEYHPQPDVHWLRGSAVIASYGTAKAVFCISPGASPGQGPDEQDSGEQLVLSQFELNLRNGQDYYRLNMPIKWIEIELAHGGDAGIEAAYMEWVTLGIEIALSGRRKITFPDNTKWLVLETSITLEPDKKTVKTRLRLEPQVVGIEADTHTPTQPTELPPVNWQPPGSPYTNLPVDPIILYPPTPPSPNIPGNANYSPDASGNMVFIASDENNLILVTNYKRWLVYNTPVNYITLEPPLDETHSIVQAVPSGLGIDVYCLTTDGDQSRLHYCENPLIASPLWTSSSLLTGAYFRIITSDTDGEIYLQGALTAPAGCADAWEIANGTETARTADTISASSAFVSGSDRITVQVEGYLPTTPPNVTCRHISWVMDSGGTTLQGWFICGSDYPADEVTGSADVENCVYFLDLLGAAPFTVTFTLYADEDCGECIAPSGAATVYSADHGTTFADAEISGTVAGGADMIKIGNPIFVGDGNQVMTAALRGDPYLAYGDPLPNAATADLILLPRFRPGSSTTDNINTDTPQMVVGSSVLSDDDESLWFFTGGGLLFSDITPLHSGTPGTIVGPYCLTMPWRSGLRIAAIFDFAGTRYLYTRVSPTWTARSTLSAADYIRMRKGDKNLRELYIANGGSAVYSGNFGATLYSKTIPVTGDIVSLEVYG